VASGHTPRQNWEVTKKDAGKIGISKFHKIFSVFCGKTTNPNKIATVASKTTARPITQSLVFQLAAIEFELPH
jgi:hypothetical protein